MVTIRLFRVRLTSRRAEAYAAVAKGVMASGILPLFDSKFTVLSGTFRHFLYAFTLSWDNLSRNSCIRWRRRGLMVSALVPGSSGPGSSLGRGHCVVSLGKTLNSHSASLHPGV